MSKKLLRSPLPMTVGTVFTAGMLTTGVATAEPNPFSYTDLSTGYMVATSEGAKAEGEDPSGEKAEGEGTYSGKEEQAKEGKQVQEGKCGEGKCGGDM